MFGAVSSPGQKGSDLDAVPVELFHWAGYHQRLRFLLTASHHASVGSSWGPGFVMEQLPAPPACSCPAHKCSDSIETC